MDTINSSNTTNSISKLDGISGVIRGVAVSTALLLPQIAYSDGVDEPVEIALQQRGHPENIAKLLRLEIYGISTFDLAEYTDEDTYLYYLNTLDNPIIGSQTGLVLRKIQEITGYTFGWIDIPSIADLVIAKHSGDLILWQEAYNVVIHQYPTLSVKLIGALSQVKYVPGEAI